MSSEDKGVIVAFRRLKHQIEANGMYFGRIDGASSMDNRSNEWFEHASIWLDSCVDGREIEAPDGLVMIDHAGKRVVLRCNKIIGQQCTMDEPATLCGAWMLCKHGIAKSRDEWR